MPHWNNFLGDPTLVADPILDRVVHQAHSQNLAGKTLRKLTPKLTPEAISEQTSTTPQVAAAALRVVDLRRMRRHPGASGAGRLYVEF
ncbi:ATP-binding protein [Acidithiobacillus sp. IBUN Pt1247-S3]|uniref:ATP-binding protein n=1 Tax=Acidithiobacillus sp. IBUN Pt1247-S3 TaxID=3166642 RepID=UPI0034E4D52B